MPGDLEGAVTASGVSPASGLPARLFESEVLREKAVLQRLTEQLSDVADLQSPHQVESVHLHRPHADPQATGDIAVGIALRYQFQDFVLPRRQPVRSFAGRLMRLGRFCDPSGLGRLGGLDRPHGFFGANSFAWFHNGCVSQILLLVILAYLGKSVKTITGPPPGWASSCRWSPLP